MDLINTNDHLNIYNYYNLSENVDPKENNLSRSLAITLTNDKDFLNEVFKEFVLEKDHKELFSLDYNNIEDENIYIDIQTSAGSNKISDKSYERYIGVLLGDFEDINITDKQIKNQVPSDTANPIPDIVIGIQNSLVIIETKLRGEISDFRQLKGHVKSIIENNYKDNDKENIDVKEEYKLESWENILQKAMDFYQNDDESKVFVGDFIGFVRKFHPELMPVLPLNEINMIVYGKVENIELIEQRLEVIKALVAKKYFNKEELSQKGNRNAIPVNFDWASEANFYLDNKNKNIILEIWPADTKGQGDELYKEEMEDRALSFLDESELKVNNDIYKLNIQPYIKFANWNRGVKWINNLLNIENNYKDTHNYNTFDKLAGRYKNNENKNEWKDLEKILDNKINGDWRKSVSWKEKFIKSGKTTIDISLGAKVEVEIPYRKAQKLDDDKDDPKLVKEIYDILTNLKEMIDQ